MKKTVGSIASSLIKETNDTLSPIEIQRATEQEYLDNLVWCVKHFMKKVECIPECKEVCDKRPAHDGDFYVAALVKKEKLLQNVLRNYFIPTLSCPTPHFDQTVYRYNSKKDDIEFLWVVPDQETAEIFHANMKQIVPEERALLKYVIEYYDGTLFRLAKSLNGETEFAGSALKEK